MQSKKFRPSLLVTLSAGAILVFSTVSPARVWGQERWPLYLPIVVNQSNLTPADPSEQVTPEVPGEQIPPDATATPNAPETRSPGLPERSS